MRDVKTNLDPILKSPTVPYNYNELITDYMRYATRAAEIDSEKTMMTYTSDVADDLKKLNSVIVE